MKIVLASPNDQKYPRYPLVLEFTLARQLRLLILKFCKWKFLSDGRRFYLHDSQRSSRSVDGLTHTKQLLNLLCIVYKVKSDQRTAPHWTYKRWRNTSSVGEILDELEWPSLEARRDQFSLLLFHKIHFGAVSIEKDKYMTPAHSLKTTRSSQSAQYRRHQTYSYALKNPPPRTSAHWNSLSPFVTNTQSTEEFRALSLKQKISQKLFLCP